jgi:hypothetical protein
MNTFISFQIRKISQTTTPVTMSSLNSKSFVEGDFSKVDHQSNMETKTDCDPSGNPTSTSTSASKKRPADDELSNEHIFDQSDDGVGRENKVLRRKDTKDTDENVLDTSQNRTSFVDIAQELKLAEGTRVQVRWEISIGDKEEIKWWSGILLPQNEGQTHTLHDDDDEVVVPVRQIDYDPYIEGGFPERSVEHVCFLSDHSILNMSDDARAFWRKEGDDWEPSNEDEDERNLFNGDYGTEADVASDDDVSVSSSSPEDALHMILNSVLQTALKKTGVMDRMEKLPQSQQGIIAERIAKAKEKLMNKLLEQSMIGDGGLERVITKEHVLQCMQELQDDL